MPQENAQPNDQILSVEPKLETPPTVIPPVVDEPDESLSEIERYNRQLEEETGDSLSDDEPEIGDVEKDDPEPGDEENKTGEPAEEIETIFEFTPDLPIEDFEERKNAYLETVEITPELKGIVEYYEARAAESREKEAEFEVFGGRDAVSETMAAIVKMHETEMVGDAVIPNAKPLVEHLLKSYPNEFSTIARNVFSSPSTKHEGTTVFEEILIDDFGANPESVYAIQQFLANGSPLPAAPPVTPAGVDAKFAAAFNDLPEVKRFEIENLIDEISTLKAEAEETENEYTKSEITAELGKKQATLNGELKTLEKIQFGIDSQRQHQEIAQRQQSQAIIAFETRVFETYEKELDEMKGAFTSDLAPKLTFLDSDAQISQAKNIMARIDNALAFEVDNSMKLIELPRANKYAEDLKTEGVKFDFGNARTLLHNHLLATRKVEMLIEQKASQPTIDHAKRIKDNLLKDIKGEQKSLIGQLTAKYVKSSGAALQKKVESAAAAKQKTRAVISKGSGAAPRQSSELKPGDIKDYNRRHAAALAAGDLDALEDFYG